MSRDGDSMEQQNTFNNGRLMASHAIMYSDSVWVSYFFHHHFVKF